MRVTDGCDFPSGRGEEDLGPLEEQLLLSTTEPPLQPQKNAFKETHPSSKNKDSKGTWVVGCSSADACVVTQHWVKLRCF